MAQTKIGQNIRTLRIEKQYSQKKLAEILSVAQNTVSNWENGTREPDHETLIKLSEIFNISTDYLLGNSEIKYPEKNLEILQGKEGLYFYIAEKAKDMDLSKKDIDKIIDIYKRIKE